MIYRVRQWAGLGFLACALIAGCHKQNASSPPQSGQEKTTGSATQPGTGSTGPRLSIARTTLDAGELDFGKPSDSTFPIRNDGGQPLRLTVVKKSCFCAEVSLSPAAIAPGQEGSVKLHWVPIPGKTGPYTMAADLTSNDPLTPALRLEVKARIKPLVRILPEGWSYIDFDRIRPQQPVQRELKVVAATLPDFHLQATVSNPDFEVVTQKLTDPRGVGDFKSGYSVVVRTTDRLPAGYLRKALHLDLDIPNQAPRSIDLPIYAEMESGALKVRPREVEFNHPRVTDEDAKKLLVQFFVPAERETIEVVRCEPSFITCNPPRRIKPGTWEITVRLPRGNPEAAQYQADHFFEGKLVLKTSASPVPFPVRMKWLPPGS